jgi:hypothetical protein
MASVFAVFALVTHCIEQKFVAKSAEYDLVELALNELVAVHFVDLLLASTNSALTAKSSRAVDGALANILLDYMK